MAASAYAALASLSHVLEQIQHPARHRLRFDRSQIETLQEMVGFVLDLFEHHSTAVYEAEEEDVLRAMANCITKAEDVIDSHVVDQLSQRSTDKADLGYSSVCEHIEGVIQKLKNLKEVFAESREKKRSSPEQQPSVSLPATVASSAPFGKSTMVGFDDHVDRIKDRLTGGESGLQVVPIVGMGGIGKTTLAQNIFHDTCFKNHFEVRIWFTISQEYRVPDILLGLLREVGEKESSDRNIAELGQNLRKKLFGRRYLIVLDDVWSVNVWDDLKLYFPDTNEGSRIIVTTRLSSISDSLGNENSYSVDLLDDEKSWKLLCEKVFGKVGCPDPELEKIGRTIAGGCKGLPLAIVVIGGLLSKSNMTLEKWEEVAENVNSIVHSEADELCLNILSLSYNHLPIHLKPCFLYMRVYPEDYHVRVSQLIQSWIAEGFVISKGGQTLEEVAGEYLKDLIHRNLIFTNNEFGYGSNMMKMVGIHDLLRDLCIRENRRENTFRIAKVYVGELMQEREFDREGFERRNICSLCGDREVFVPMCFPILSGDTEETEWGNYPVCYICGMIVPHLDTFRSVEIVRLKKRGFPPITTKLRYLDARDRYYYFYPTWLHLFWNLRSLVFGHFTSFFAKDYRRAVDVVDLPSEIWNMPQLRHVKFYKAILPEPPVAPVDGEDSIILESLETLGLLVDFSCSEEIVARIPNVRKLRIGYFNTGRDLSYFEYHNLTRLHKLESFAISWRCFYFAFSRVMKEFPRSLKKLTLEHCEFSWEDMTIIGSLPNLEVLKLKHHAFKGESWNPVEGEFLQLKSMWIHNHDLASWNAEKEHFPKLESLVLGRMISLNNFPLGIGEIDTLLSINLFLCSDELVNSAKELVAEQQTYGNVGLHLHVEGF